jgi:hypothetical protein
LARVTKPEDRAFEALNDPELRDQAIDLAPTVFAALRIAAGIEANRFPLSTAKDLDAVLRTVVGNEERFRSRGVAFSREEALEHFPDEFFPVTDRVDLLKKAHLAIVIAHTASERRTFEESRVSPGDFKVSHPMPEGVL